MTASETSRSSNRPPRRSASPAGAPPPPPGPPGQTFTLARLLHHVGKLLDDEMRDRLDRLGLHPSQGRVLHLLTVRDGQSQRELTDHMRIAAPTVSGVLKRMETAGLIERRGTPEDERVTRVYLTASGRKLGRTALAVVDEIEQSLVAGLSVRQLRDAHALLRKLRHNLGGEAPFFEPPVSQMPWNAADKPIEAPRRRSPHDRRKPEDQDENAD